jgi:hypothetical protein
MSSLSVYRAEMEAVEEHDQTVLSDNLKKIFAEMNKETERCQQILAVSLNGIRKCGRQSLVFEENPYSICIKTTGATFYSNSSPKTTRQTAGR